MGFLAEPQKSLVPVGGGFFATPDSPADPRDCDRFPNSPWCGGGFLDRRALALDPKLISDHCNLGVSFNGTLAFIRLPTVQIVYRNPACQPPPPPPPVVAPVADNKCARLVCNDGSVITTVLHHEEAQPVNQYPVPVFPEDTDAQEVCNVRYSYFLASAQNITRNLPKFIKNIKINLVSFSNGWYAQQESLPRFKVARTVDGVTYPASDVFTTQDSPPTRLSIYEGNIECNDFCFYAEYDYPTGDADEITPYFGDYYHVKQQIGTWTTTRFKVPLCTIVPDPPPPKPPKKMDCCPQNEQLLKLILKRIGEPKKVTIFDEYMDRKGTQKADKTPESLNEYLKLTVERIEIVNRLLGIDNYPMTVPDTMITPFQEGVFAKVFKFIDGKKKRKINSITELIAWMSEQDSAVLGEFHQVIQFETEDKKQSSVVLPNVAEALKEIVLLTSQMAKQNNTQTELIFKIAAEVVATRAAATKGSAIAEDIQDYLDYPTERKTAKIPSSISLPKININKEGIPIATSTTENHKTFLKPGEIKYVYEDWTGDNSLHDQLLDLLQLASMLRAVYFQRTDK